MKRKDTINVVMVLVYIEKINNQLVFWADVESGHPSDWEPAIAHKTRMEIYMSLYNELSQFHFNGNGTFTAPIENEGLQNVLRVFASKYPVKGYYKCEIGEAEIKVVPFDKDYDFIYKWGLYPTISTGPENAA
jgi:hypothetical protein